MFDGTPNSNIVVFHARPTSSPGQRWSYTQDTSSINRNPNTAFFKQDGTVNQAAVDGAALPIQAPQTVNPPEQGRAEQPLPDL